jgi:hypothetical protein
MDSGLAPSARPGMTADEKDLRRTTSIPDQIGAEMLAGIHDSAAGFDLLRVKHLLSLP